MKEGVVLMYCTPNIIGSWAYNSININRKYAEKNNYDFDLVTKPYDSLYTHAWQKIPAIIDLLNKGYKFVIYIDADAIVNKTNVKIENFLDKYPGDIIVCSDEANSNGECAVNGGVIIVRNTEKAKDFLLKWWNLRSIYLEFSYEQLALSDITKNKLKDIDGSIVSIAPENEFNSICNEMKTFAENYNTMDKPDIFIFHFMDTNENVRKEILSYLNIEDIEVKHGKNGYKIFILSVIIILLSIYLFLNFNIKLC